MPDARRHQHWAPHCGRACSFDASKLETRWILRRSQASGKTAAPVASRVPRTMPEHSRIVPMKSAWAVAFQLPQTTSSAHHLAHVRVEWVYVKNVESLRNEWTRITHWISARACRTILIHCGGLSAGQLKSAPPKASSWRRRSARMGTPGRVSRKWAIRPRRSCNGAPCPITIIPLNDLTDRGSERPATPKQKPLDARAIGERPHGSTRCSYETTLALLLSWYFELAAGNSFSVRLHNSAD